MVENLTAEGDCCREEIKSFALPAKEKIGGETIEVNWKD